MVTGFYDKLREQGRSARSVRFVRLLLRQCLDEVSREEMIPFDPVRHCAVLKMEKYKSTPFALGGKFSVT